MRLHTMAPFHWDPPLPSPAGVTPTSSRSTSSPLSRSRDSRPLLRLFLPLRPASSCSSAWATPTASVLCTRASPDGGGWRGLPLRALLSGLLLLGLRRRPRPHPRTRVPILSRVPRAQQIIRPRELPVVLGQAGRRCGCTRRLRAHLLHRARRWASPPAAAAEPPGSRSAAPSCCGCSTPSSCRVRAAVWPSGKDSMALRSAALQVLPPCPTPPPPERWPALLSAKSCSSCSCRLLCTQAAVSSSRDRPPLASSPSSTSGATGAGPRQSPLPPPLLSLSQAVGLTAWAVGTSPGYPPL